MLCHQNCTFNRHNFHPTPNYGLTVKACLQNVCTARWYKKDIYEILRTRGVRLEICVVCVAPLAPERCEGDTFFRSCVTHTDRWLYIFCCFLIHTLWFALFWARNTAACAMLYSVDRSIFCHLQHTHAHTLAIITKRRFLALTVCTAQVASTD